jgi:hypothetical protein
MRRFLLASSLALVVTGGALAKDHRDVTVVNATGYSIKFLAFNTVGNSDWSHNVLPGVFADGQSLFVNFTGSDKSCMLNLKIEWADPGYPGVMWQNVDVCRLSKLTLHYDENTTKTSYDAE